MAFISTYIRLRGLQVVCGQPAQRSRAQRGRRGKLPHHDPVRVYILLSERSMNSSSNFIDNPITEVSAEAWPADFIGLTWFVN